MARSKQKRQKKKNKGTLVNVILGVIMLVGIGIIAYPSFSDWWNNFHQSRAIASYVEQVAQMDQETFDRMWAEAEAYNEKLKGNSNRMSLTEAELKEYNAVLDVTGTGIMGYIDIPKIDISLPVYHGTDEAVLQIAIGHIEGTSLPVGGLGTHSVMSGHRGLPSAKLFSDLDQLEVGDRFLLQILDRTLTYEVDQIRIVLPTELQDLQIDDGADLSTLVTCTPYGINTHRLLVRGHRVENAAEDARVVADAMQLEPVIIAPLVAAPVLLFLLIILLLLTSGRTRQVRERTHREAREAAKKLAEKDMENEK